MKSRIGGQMRFASIGAALAAAAVSLFLENNQAIAAPVNLLTNPGFETGTLAGWTAGGNSAISVDTAGTAIPGTFFPSVVGVNSGIDAAYAVVNQGGVLSPADKFITLSQTIAVAPSTTYSIGYFAAVFDPNANIDGPFGFGNSTVNPGLVDIKINGASIAPTFPLLINNAFIEVLGSFATGAGQTSLTVLYSASASGTGSVGLSLDDFFFTAEAQNTATPLPAALPLFASGLGGLGLLSWCRKKKAAALAA
jgi:hypothetical protein